MDNKILPSYGAIKDSLGLVFVEHGILICFQMDLTHSTTTSLPLQFDQVRSCMTWQPSKLSTLSLMVGGMAYERQPDRCPKSVLKSIAQSFWLGCTIFFKILLISLFEISACPLVWGWYGVESLCTTMYFWSKTPMDLL